MSSQCRHGKLARQCEVCQLENDVEHLTNEVCELEATIRDLKLDNPRYHPQLHLLAVERTGIWRYIFGRWVYSDEPFRRDIQRRCAASGMDRKLVLQDLQLYDPEDNENSS